MDTKTEELIKATILEQYNIMARNVYLAHYQDCDPAGLRLMILQEITKHVVTRTVDILESDQKRTNRKLDVILKKIEMIDASSSKKEISTEKVSNAIQEFEKAFGNKIKEIKEI